MYLAKGAFTGFAFAVGRALVAATVASLVVGALTAGIALAADVPQSGPSVDFSHGPLKVSQNKRYLTFADGTPFYYLGDTAWELFDRLDRDDALKYLEDRRQKGFTVVQAVVLAELDGLNSPNAYGDKPLTDNDPAKPNEAYFRHVDFILNAAREKGMFIGMLPTWGDKVGPQGQGTGPQGTLNKANARAYGRFLGARYKGAPNIIWILGGDRSPQGYEPVWRELAAGLCEGDGGTHLMTYHPAGSMSSSDYLSKETWLDFNMQQSGHAAVNTPNYDSVTRDYRKQPTRPCIDGEPRYEDHPVNWDPRNGWFDDYDVRQGAYWAVFAGAFGNTYGCHDIWQMLTTGFPAISSARTPWQLALDLPGAWDMKHLRDLMESRPMLDRVPDQTMLVAGKGGGGSVVRSTRGTDYAFVYSAAGKPFTLQLGGISGKTLKAYWFDPREGTSLSIADVPNEGVQEFTPPTLKTGRGCDWALVLDDAAKGYAAPGTLVEWDPALVTALSAKAAAEAATAGAAASAKPIVAPSGLPRPIVELLFESVADNKTPNTGASAADFPFATLTKKAPTATTSTHAPWSLGALDFGTRAADYAAEVAGPVDPLGGLDAFTITGWLNCRSEAEGAGGNRVVTWINDGGQGVDLVYRSDGSLQLSVNQWPDSSPARSTPDMVTADARVDQKNWVFFAVTYDSGNDDNEVAFYFGSATAAATLDQTLAYAQGAVGSNIGPGLAVGHFDKATRSKATDRMFRGLIDDVRIYDRALTGAQIAAVQGL